jgi:hypothetical protein
MAGSNRGRVKRSGNQRLFGRKPLPVTMPFWPFKSFDQFSILSAREFLLETLRGWSAAAGAAFLGAIIHDDFYNSFPSLLQKLLATTL